MKCCLLFAVPISLLFAFTLTSCSSSKEDEPAQPVKMEVQTSEVSEITSSTAVCGGEVSSGGESQVIARGVVWSTSSNPTTDACAKTSDGSGLGKFTSILTGLSASTTYYVRSYAINSTSTAYGKEIIFTTKDIIGMPTVITSSVSSVTISSASCGGEVTSDGGATVTERGAVWSMSSIPTVENCMGKTSDGSGLGKFTSRLTGLSASTTYYVRSYATNSIGTVYGEETSFITEAHVVIPTVITSSVYGVTATSAVCGGEVTSDGGASVTVRGVVWGISQNPTLENCMGKTTDGGGTGIFISEISGLDAVTTYFVRSYATNSVGTTYGEQESFTTTPTKITGGAESYENHYYEW